MKPYNICYADFEFNRVTHRYVNLVCTVTYDPYTNKLRKWWLHNDKREQTALRKYLSKFAKVIAYQAIAEGRSYLSLGLDPLDFKWIDMFIEYRQLTNNNDELQWGKQLVDGKVKRVRKPKPKHERTEEDRGTGFKATHSLAEATYKLLGEVRDTKHKTEMRDLIISDPPRFTKAQRRAIMNYCAEDVIHMPRMWKKIKSWNLKLNPRITLKEYVRGAIERGSTQAAAAHQESRGYPINVEATKNFSSQVPSIIYDVQREINKLFPEIKPFKWNKRENRFRWDQKITKQWISENHDTDRWMKTDKGQLSLALDAFTKFYDFKHTYPEDSFGAQMVRFLKLKQNIYGFSQKTDPTEKTFWSYVGPDGMVRPYLNTFGAQTSRSQPASKGFMFLKPAWMRALVQPPKGTFMCGIDYSSQEFLISALESGDKNMINAYLSGDPYLYFAKLAGAVPKDGKREDYETERDLFKATTLGLSYMMSKVGLAVKLTQDTGRVWTEDEAQDMIDTFYEVFWKLKEYQENLQEYYESGNPLVLPDGWTMFCDNENFRSVGNMPIQGRGGVIIRRATMATMKQGIYVPFSLHDALYMWDEIGNEHNIIKMRDAMREAFVSVFPDHLKKYAEKIRLDAFAWSPDYKPNSELYVGKEKWKVKASDLYIDKRAISEYQKFSKYFEPRAEDRL